MAKTERKKPKNKAAVLMAHRRAKSLSPERRSEIAQTAGKARWKGHVKADREEKT